jgi:hypothetical protein
MSAFHASTESDPQALSGQSLIKTTVFQQTKPQSLLGGTIAEKFGGSSKDILEEE